MMALENPQINNSGKSSSLGTFFYGTFKRKRSPSIVEKVSWPIARSNSVTGGRYRGINKRVMLKRGNSISIPEDEDFNAKTWIITPILSPPVSSSSFKRARLPAQTNLVSRTLDKDIDMSELKNSLPIAIRPATVPISGLSSKPSTTNQLHDEYPTRSSSKATVVLTTATSQTQKVSSSQITSPKISNRETTPMQICQERGPTSTSLFSRESPHLILTDPVNEKACLSPSSISASNSESKLDATHLNHPQIERKRASSLLLPADLAPLIISIRKAEGLSTNTHDQEPLDEQRPPVPPKSPRTMQRASRVRRSMMDVDISTSPSSLRSGDSLPTIFDDAGSFDLTANEGRSANILRSKFNKHSDNFTPKDSSEIWIGMRTEDHTPSTSLSTPAGILHHATEIPKFRTRSKRERTNVSLDSSLYYVPKTIAQDELVHQRSVSETRININRSRTIC